MKEFKPRDKLTQRMTRDGAVLDNQTTGEEIHISERDAEKQLSPNGQRKKRQKRQRKQPSSLPAIGKVCWSFWLVFC